MESTDRLLVVITFCSYVAVLVFCWEIIKEVRASRKQAKNDLELHQKWLFDALYSINNKVVLPEPKIEDEVTEPAQVYSPFKDPLNSLKGMRNDWHGGD